MKKRKIHGYIEEKRKNIVEIILNNVRLHERLIRYWQGDVGSHISYEFEFGEKKDADSIFQSLEEKFLGVKSKTLNEGMLLGLWDGAHSICWSHEENVACTDEEKNAEDKRIYNSARKYYDKYDNMLLNILANGRGYEYKDESFLIRARQGDKYDEYAVVMSVDYTVNGENFTEECTVSDETIEALCHWENFSLEEQEEFCYSIVDYYDDDHKLFSFGAEKSNTGINVTVTVFNRDSSYKFKRNMSRIEYCNFVNFFDIIRIVLFDSGRCWI